MKETFCGATGCVGPAPTHATPRGRSLATDTPLAVSTKRESVDFRTSLTKLQEWRALHTVTFQQPRPRERPHSPSVTSGPELFHITPGASGVDSGSEASTPSSTTTSALRSGPAATARAPDRCGGQTTPSHRCNTRPTHQLEPAPPVTPKSRSPAHGHDSPISRYYVIVGRFRTYGVDRYDDPSRARRRRRLASARRRGTPRLSRRSRPLGDQNNRWTDPATQYPGP